MAIEILSVIVSILVNKIVFDALNNPGNAKITPGTSRVLEVLRLLGSPQSKYKVIHITGTNGKGSTAAFIETGLIHAGYRTGKFTSPHIKVINESITLNNQNISDENIELSFWQIDAILTKHQIILSPFELLTVIMFNYFAKFGVDYLVLEVGMGGMDDATNVVSPIVSIITNIGLEHTKFLGDTLADIARAKAGIIKNGLTVIADNTPELLDAVLGKTSNYINVLDAYKFRVRLDYENFKTILEIDVPDDDKAIYHLNMFGFFQAYNFLAAYATLRHLRISVESINYAAKHAYNPGRLEVRGYNPLLLFDAAHNLSGAKSLSTSLAGNFDLQDVVIVTSILSDKDISGMLLEFANLASSIVCTSISNNPRAVAAGEISELAKPFFQNIQVATNPLAALDIAISMNKKVILVTGSLYLVSAIYCS